MDGMDRVRDLCGRITDLSDQELTELRDLVLGQFDTTNDQAGDVPDEDTLAVMRELADASEAVQKAIDSRNAARSERSELAGRRDAAGSAELAVDGATAEAPPAEGAGADGDKGEGDGAEGTEDEAGTEGAGDTESGEAGDGAAGEDGEAVTASGDPAPGTIQPPADRRPKATGPAVRQVVTASADVPGFHLGQELDNPLAVGEAMTRRIDTLRNTRGGDGEQVIVASIRLDGIPEERHLKVKDPDGNYNKVMDVIRPKAITAAGGTCAPVDTRYELFGGGVTDRPVKSALPGYTADRGGIRFITPPTLAQLQGAVGIWTLANDEDAALPDDPGATPPFVSPTKPVLRVDCGAEVVVHTQAVTVGLVFGNMQARAYPEMVARHNDLAMVAHARVAEQQLLAQIGALSLHVTTPTQVVGAVRHTLVQVDKALASYRNRYRTGPLPIRLIFPQWFKDLLRADIALQLPGDGLDVLALADSIIEGWFRARNTNVTWALDGESGQDYAAQGDNAVLQAFPETVIWYLFVEGTFLFLDGGTLDLGIVRDSTLNSKNDYQTFVETFEAVAKVGHEGLRVSTSLDPTGASSAAVAVGAEAI